MDIGFRPTPKEYYVPTEKCGKMTRIRYTSSTYDENPIAIEKDALVYLPYGYENSVIDYDVFYLMHGGGGDSNEVFGGEEAKTPLKTILDNMIEKGDVKPFIVVAPSFHYKGTESAKRSTVDARLLTQHFHHEFVNDLIPTVEKNFRVKSGREHRAFGGYSMGSEATWNIFAKCLPEVKYFLPMSGDCWAVMLQGGLKEPVKTALYLENSVKENGFTKDDFKIFACVGDNGVAYVPMDTMIKEMKNHTDTFVFTDSPETGNSVYCVAVGGTHSYVYCYQYVYNALPYFFK